MVDMNFGRSRPAGPARPDPGAGADAAGTRADGLLRVGAGVSYATLITELGALLPGLAMASRTVGSPQIRNRGTLGGNLGSASPAGDTLPVLLASGAVVETASAQGSRRIPAGDFCTGVKQNALRPGELIAAVLLRPAPDRSSSARWARATRWSSRWPRSRSSWTRPGGGSAPASGRRRRPRAARPPPRTSWPGCWPSAGCGSGPGWTWTRRTCDRFGELAAAAAAPIDDVRGTAAYRTHALAVMARRALRWAWQDYMSGGRERAGELRGQRGTADRRRRVGGREPAVRAARAARPAGQQERLRAGRVRVVHGGHGRRHGLRVPGGGRAGAGPGHPDRRGAGRDRRDRGAGGGRRAASGAAGLSRGRRGAVRLLHARAHRAGGQPAAGRPEPVRRARSARRWPGTCAAAPGTRRSWMRSGWPPGAWPGRRRAAAGPG